MAYCEAEDMVEMLFPSFDFKESLTPHMQEKMKELPPQVRKKVMDAGFRVGGDDIREMVLATNPQRQKSMNQKRNWEEIESSMKENPEIMAFAEQMVGKRGKKQTMNAEQMFAATYGLLERWKKISANGSTIADMIEKGDEDMVHWVVAKMNEAQALTFQLRGAKAEAGRTLGFVNRLNKMENEAGDFATLFNSMGC